jgi:hypothetical protein
MNRLGWIVAAVLAVALLLVFAWRSDAPTAEAPDPSIYEFDPSTAVLTEPPPPADTEKRVGPADDTVQIERTVHEEAEQTRREQDAHDTYPAIYKR